MKYEFHPEAELEVLEVAAHYEVEVRGLGLQFGTLVWPNGADFAPEFLREKLNAAA